MNDKLKKHLEGIRDPVITIPYSDDPLHYYRTVIGGMRHLAAECLTLIEDNENEQSDSNENEQSDS